MSKLVKLQTRHTHLGCEYVTIIYEHVKWGTVEHVILKGKENG